MLLESIQRQRTMIVGGIELDDKVVYTLAGLGVAIGLYASTQLHANAPAKLVDTNTQSNASKSKKGGVNKNKKKNKKDGSGGATLSTGSHEKEREVKQKQQASKTQKSAEPAKKPAEPAQQPQQSSKTSKNKSKPSQQPQQQLAQAEPSVKLTAGEFNDVDSGEWTTINSKKKAVTPTTERAAFIDGAEETRTAPSAAASKQVDEDAWERAPAVSTQAALNPDSAIYQDGNWTWSEKGGAAIPNVTINTPLAESTLLQTHNQTSVDDMMDASVQSDQTNARVMRITKDPKHTAVADDGWTMAGSKKTGVRGEQGG